MGVGVGVGFGAAGFLILLGFTVVEVLADVADERCICFALLPALSVLPLPVLPPAPPALSSFVHHTVLPLF